MCPASICTEPAGWWSAAVSFERADEMAGLKNNIVRFTGGINALNETVRRIIHEGGGSGRFPRRYENPSTTG